MKEIVFSKEKSAQSNILSHIKIDAGIILHE